MRNRNCSIFARLASTRWLFQAPYTSSQYVTMDMRTSPGDTCLNSRVSPRGEASLLIDPFRRDVLTCLLEYKLVYCPASVHFEGNLGVHNFQKILLLAFREQLNLWLPRGLRKEVFPFACDGQNEIRGQPIPPRVLVE